MGLSEDGAAGFLNHQGCREHAGLRAVSPLLFVIYSMTLRKQIPRTHEESVCWNSRYVGKEETGDKCEIHKCFLSLWLGRTC